MDSKTMIILWNGVFARFNRLRREEGGASVLEWALIAAVVVVAAAVIGGVIMNIVNRKADTLNRCADATGACK